jgi:tripartite-type tricarboxylate transporter receptor subunit TctC
MFHRMIELPAAVLSCAVLLACPVDAQTWPDRPIKLIVTQAAGGTPDILARLVTDEVGKRLGGSFVVENRPGGGNVVGTQAAARSPPDGYTFLWATAAGLVTNPYTFKALPYDPFKDFVTVGKVAEGPFILLAHPDVPVSDLKSLMAYAKANPAKLNFATDGAKNFSGMIAAWINKLGGMDIPQVPYSAMPQGAQDTIAGRVQLVVLAVPSARPLMEAGKLKALASSMPKRVPGLEQVPAVAETFPGFDLTGWMALAAPAGTPAPIVERMNRELDAVLKTPAMVKRLAGIGFFTDGAGTLAEAAAYVKSQHEAWGKIIPAIGIKPE